MELVGLAYICSAPEQCHFATGQCTHQRYMPKPANSGKVVGECGLHGSSKR